MKRHEQDEWVRSNDMPHEIIMDNHNVEYKDLSTSIQADIRHFDNIYDEALKDGFIDDEEENDLIAESYKIAIRIKKEHLKLNEDSGSSGGAIGGIIAGVGIGVLALLGINQIRQK